MAEDVRGLYRAFKGFGCDEKKVIQILAHRTQLQRVAIADAYNAQYGESIHKRLKSELHGKLEAAIRLWMMGPAQRDAILVYESTHGLGTKDRALIGIICTRTPSQIYEIKQAYHSMYQQPLERQIDGDTSGDYRKLLLALVRGTRSETLAVDPNLALADAEALYQAGESRIGTNEDIIIHILTTRSPAQLNMTLQCYRQNFRHDFERAIKKETSGRFENALTAVVQSTCYPARYFAQELVDATRGLGTKDDDLIRVITTRAELDMYYIKQEFLALTDKPLEQVIASETSGDYQHFLLSVVAGI
jgi:annexin A7/11